MPCWTTKELRLLDQMYENCRPTLRDRAAAFPRHSADSVTVVSTRRHPARTDLRWLEIAHRHFAERERVMLA